MSKYEVIVYLDDGNVTYRVGLLRAIWEVWVAAKVAKVSIERLRRE